jgi:arginase family enzyme
MEFELSFKPIDHQTDDYVANQLGSFVQVYTQGHFPDLTEAELVLIGVPEYRSGFTQGSEESLAAIRKELFRLYQGLERLRVVDLGNLLLGECPADTDQLLADVLEECSRRGLVAVILGGDQSLTYAQYKSAVQLKEVINLVSVDARFDIGLGQEEKSSSNYLSKIIEHQPSFLFNYSNLAYQSYLVSHEEVELLSKMYFDAYRLGSIRGKMEEAEAILRYADLLSLDLSAVRLGDSPGVVDGSPNGLSGEEFCQIARYAGFGGRLKSIGFYEYDFSMDRGGQSAKLLAQAVWYFMEGFFHRLKKINPASSDFVKYHVSLMDGEYNITFYKLKPVDKWWMEVPLLDETLSKGMDQCLIPCTYNDYQLACQDELPTRWWKAFQKLN